MAKGTFIRTSNVKPFIVDRNYSSKMLLDKFNSESKGIQLNEGTLGPGCSTPGAAHMAPHDEIYYVIKGEAVLTMDGVKYEIAPGDVIYIPCETFHSLDNKSDTDDFVLMTIWPEHPAEGANEVYDMRLKAWGKSYETLDGK